MMLVKINFKKFFLPIILLSLISFKCKCFACDFTQPDKVKHIEISKKATSISTKVYSVPLLPLKPVKWLFNPTIQTLFPDNYVPHALAAGTVFFVSTSKELTFDVIVPGHHPDYCDVKANCIGIKEGLKK